MGSATELLDSAFSVSSLQNTHWQNISAFIAAEKSGIHSVHISYTTYFLLGLLIKISLNQFSILKSESNCGMYDVVTIILYSYQLHE